MTNYVSLPDRRLAYQQLRGAANAPQIVFLGGYASDLGGTKATFLAERCAAAGYGFLRFDYRGHGQSDGRFKDCTLGDWLQDAKDIIAELTTGPQIIIGSSMGGWLGLLLARDQPERLKAFIGIAAAPDFTEDRVWDILKPHEAAFMQQHGYICEAGVLTPDAFAAGTFAANPAIVTRKMAEEARAHLVLRQPLTLKCPVRLLQGMQDQEVPWELATRLATHAACEDFHITLIKDGDHRLSRVQDLELMWGTVRGFS